MILKNDLNDNCMSLLFMYPRYFVMYIYQIFI